MIRGQSQSNFPKKGSVQKVLFDTVRPPSRKKSNTQFQSTKLERENMKDKYGSIAASIQGGKKSNNNQKRTSTLHVRNNGGVKVNAAGENVKYEIVPNILRKIERNCQILRNLHKNEQKRMSSKENSEAALNGIRKVQYPQDGVKMKNECTEQVPAKNEGKRPICPNEKNIVELYKTYKQHFDAQPQIEGFISSNGDSKKISNSHKNNKNNTSCNQRFSASVSGQSGGEELARSKDSTRNKKNEKNTQPANSSQYQKNRKEISIEAPAKPNFKKPKLESNVFIEEQQAVNSYNQHEKYASNPPSRAGSDDYDGTNLGQFQSSRFYVQRIPPFHSRQQIEIDAEDSLLDCEIPKMEIDILDSEGLFAIDL